MYTYYNNAMEMIRNAVMLGFNKKPIETIVLDEGQTRVLDMIQDEMTRSKYRDSSKLKKVLLSACTSRIWYLLYPNNKPICYTDISSHISIITTIRNYIHLLIPDTVHSVPLHKCIDRAYNMLTNYPTNPSMNTSQHTQQVIFQTAIQSVEDTISTVELYNFRVTCIHREWCNVVYNRIRSYIMDKLPGIKGIYVSSIFITAFVGVCITFIGAEDYMNLKRKILGITQTLYIFS